MKLVDANVLLYAVNRDAVPHEPVRIWWENALSSQEPIGLCWIVLLAFLRLSTNSRVFTQPLTVEDAIAQVDEWLAHPNTRLIAETEEQWQRLQSLLRTTGTAANLTTDAFLAAIAISLNATVASCDMDFRRFPGLRWENPTSGAQAE